VRAEPSQSLEARDTATSDHDTKLSRADHLRPCSDAVFGAVAPIHGHGQGGSVVGCADPVDAGLLKNGIALEPDGSPIATTYTAEQLARRISR
jgi:hypothetical protein